MEKPLKKMFVVWSASKATGEILCAGYVTPEAAKMAASAAKRGGEAFLGYSVFKAPEGELALRWHSMLSSPEGRAKEVAKGLRKTLKGEKSHFEG